MSCTDHLILKRESNGAEVASCEVMGGVDESEILDIAVVSTYRRQGLALGLLTEVFAWAKQNQRQAVWLEVRASNAGAIALYEKVGFLPIRVRKNYYKNGDATFEDAIVMKYKV